MLRIQQICALAVVVLGFGWWCADASAQFGSPSPEPDDPFALAPQPAPQPVPQPAAAKPAAPPCHCLGEASSPSAARINKVLDAKLHAAGLKFNDTPLAEVANTLQEEYEIPVFVDALALEDIGLAADEPVSVNVHNVTLRSALRTMLRQLQLTSVIRNEMLVITTPDEAENELVVCVYSVGDLCITDRGTLDVDPLIDAIVSTIASETWAENGGGDAEVCEMPFGALVISQTQAVHDEIRQLLRALRAAAASAPRTRAAGAAPIPREEAVVTRYFELPSDNSDRWGPQLVRLIRDSLPDQRWRGTLDDGRRVLLVALPDRLVVRHRQSVVWQVERLLRDIGVEPRFQGRGGGGGMSGGIADGEGGGEFGTQPETQAPFGPGGEKPFE